MSENEIDELRRRFAREAMALMERKGEEVSRTRLAAELSVARARIDAVFPEESDLLEAVTAEWFAPKLAVMDEVMASDRADIAKRLKYTKDILAQLITAHRR